MNDEAVKVTDEPTLANDVDSCKVKHYFLLLCCHEIVQRFVVWSLFTPDLFQGVRFFGRSSIQFNSVLFI